MKYFRRLWLLSVLLAAATGRAATNDKQNPDREMLRLMDFLRQIEMIKQMEILHDMHDFEALADKKVRNPKPSKPMAPKKEAAQ